MISTRKSLLYGICFLFLILPSHLSLACNNEEMPTDPATHRAPRDHKASKKNWTFIVYIAADNDLRSFAARNIKQMADVGSNNNINIVVQLDIRITGNKKITRRYYIEQNKILHVNSDDATSQKMDSGDHRTLVSCCKWAIENYPADNYALILWNHGTGIIDPETGRIINPSTLFALNPENNKLELDRTVEFLDFINQPCPEDKHNNANEQDTNEYLPQETLLFKENPLDDPDRGICWDDSTGNYLTNQKLNAALSEVCNTLLGGKKLNIIGFDACLMAMLEVANITKNYAHIMIGSEEVELGAGWPYEKVLAPFGNGTLSQKAFAQHIVEAYHEVYSKITNDYTQSAIDLDNIDTLEENTSLVATLLLDCLKLQKNSSVKNAIQASRSKLLCTHFDEPSYVDLHHLYTNLLANLKHFTLTGPEQTKQQLGQALQEGQKLIKQLVIANRAGKNLSLAQGISIYFPERRIHSSYRKTMFAAKNKWINFISQYLLT